MYLTVLLLYVPGINLGIHLTILSASYLKPSQDCSIIFSSEIEPSLSTTNAIFTIPLSLFS